MNLDIEALLETAKSVVRNAADALDRADRAEVGAVTDRLIGEREVKVVADTFLEKCLLDGLAPTGIPVLSEETEDSHHQSPDGTLWIIDPLDGSYNFTKKLGPSMICVALWNSGAPVFGVLYDLSTNLLSWGGRDFPAHDDHGPIRVSLETMLSRSAVCTGFPSRFPATDTRAIGDYMSHILAFGKVRMIGSAAASLMLVARGAADAYFERQIMIWDVAAGLAVIEGAGGTISLQMTHFHEPCAVVATNGRVPFDMP
jgi:myo-inositol-1(or 4)-monophosphatase